MKKGSSINPNILAIPISIAIIGFWIYYSSKDMPKDYYGKKILEYQKQEEDLFLKHNLPDSLYSDNP